MPDNSTEKKPGEPGQPPGNLPLAESNAVSQEDNPAATPTGPEQGSAATPDNTPKRKRVIKNKGVVARERTEAFVEDLEKDFEEKKGKEQGSPHESLVAKLEENLEERKATEARMEDMIWTDQIIRLVNDEPPPSTDAISVLEEAQEKPEPEPESEPEPEELHPTPEEEAEKRQEIAILERELEEKRNILASKENELKKYDWLTGNIFHIVANRGRKAQIRWEYEEALKNYKAASEDYLLFKIDLERELERRDHQQQERDAQRLGMDYVEPEITVEQFEEDKMAELRIEELEKATRAEFEAAERERPGISKKLYQLLEWTKKTKYESKKGIGVGRLRVKEISLYDGISYGLLGAGVGIGMTTPAGFGVLALRRFLGGAMAGAGSHNIIKKLENRKFQKKKIDLLSITRNDMENLEEETKLNAKVEKAMGETFVYLLSKGQNPEEDEYYNQLKDAYKALLASNMFSYRGIDSFLEQEFTKAKRKFSKRNVYFRATAEAIGGVLGTGLVMEILEGTKKPSSGKAELATSSEEVKEIPKSQ